MAQRPPLSEPPPAPSARHDAPRCSRADTDLLYNDLYVGDNCGNVQEISDTTPVNVLDMLGLFIISGVGAAVALLLALLQRRHRWPGTAEDDLLALTRQASARDPAHQVELTARSPPPRGTGGAASSDETLRLLLSKVEDLAAAVAAQQQHGGDVARGSSKPAHFSAKV